MIRHPILCMISLIGLCGGAVRGAVLFESATLGPTGVTGGEVPGVDHAQYLGARFHLDHDVKVQSVGGHFMGLTHQYFAAIVPLSGPDALPTGIPYVDFASTFLGAASFSTPFASVDILVPLSVSLAPGDYGLVFGAGEFGTSGSGGMPRNNPEIPGAASYFM